MPHMRHILVDDYQDVNLASTRLLRAISQSGAPPLVWVAADQRQSIYRFRGAPPTNDQCVALRSGLGGSHHSLAHNYRSFAPIVRTLERFWL